MIKYQIYYMKAKANHIVGVWCKRHLRLLYRNNFFNLMVWKKLVLFHLYDFFVDWLVKNFMHCTTLGLPISDFIALYWKQNHIKFTLFSYEFCKNLDQIGDPLDQFLRKMPFNVNNLSFLRLCKIWKSDIVWFFGNPTQHLDFSQETWLAISKTHKKRLMSLSFYSEITFSWIRV